MAISLDDGINFRQLGGIKTKQGRRVQMNRLFRSGALNRLSEHDIKLLANLPLKVIIDYRDINEAQQQPDQLIPGSQAIAAPANPQTQIVDARVVEFSPEGLEALDVDPFMIALYQQLPFNNPAYQQLIDKLYHQREGALLQHCAVGKDRTGIGCAITLAILGCDRETILEDYLATNGRLTAVEKNVLAQWPDSVSEQARVNFSELLSVKDYWLDAAFTEVLSRYGSLEQWLEKEYGVTTEVAEQIRENWLE